MEEQGANSENQNSKKFLEDMNKVETILFTTGGYLKLEDLSGLTGIKSQEHLQNVLNTLKQKYSVGESSLEIVQQGNQWKLAIKKNYLPLTEQLLKESELDRPTQETLAVIAYKSPVFQSDVIKIRGNKAYDHVVTLRDLAFITADKSGRTRLLKVTQKFYDYFDVMAEQLKSKFESVEKKASALGVDINAKFVDTNSGNNGETIVNVNNLNSEANKGQTKLTENKLTEQQLEKEVEAEIKEIEKEEMKEAGSGHESKSEEKISTEIFDSENSEKKFETETAKDVNNTDGK